MHSGVKCCAEKNQQPFEIELINLNRFKGILDSQSCSLSGSDPNQSFRSDDSVFDDQKVGAQQLNHQSLIVTNHSAEVQLRESLSLSKEVPLALDNISMEVNLRDFSTED